MSDRSQDKPQAATISSTLPAPQDGAPVLCELPGRLVEDALFAPLRAIVQEAGITRQCHTVEDLSFAILCVLRVLQSAKTGRDFLQVHGIPNFPELTRGNYFATLSSKRRLSFMRQLAHHLRRRCLAELRAHDDLLAIFPELEGWEVWAGDGHKIAHATHDVRNAKDQYAPINAIYKLDLRCGWADFLALGTPTARGVEHEITTLKRQPPDELRCGASKGRSTLVVYDRAVIDFRYAYNLKQSKSIYILTQWKENLAPMTVMDREIDRANPHNQLVTSDQTVYFDNTPGQWRKITAVCPDSGESYVMLTNQMTLAPGVLNECHRLRWRIEKAFDQQEQKLDEKKAWAKSETAKSIQAISICIAHNLLQLFSATLKRDEDIEDSKVIKAYHKELDRREQEAAKAGRPFPKLLYLALYRPTELSLQFIRWMRSCLTRSTPYRQALSLLRPLMQSYL